MPRNTFLWAHDQQCIKYLLLLQAVFAYLNFCKKFNWKSKALKGTQQNSNAAWKWVDAQDTKAPTLLLPEEPLYRHRMLPAPRVHPPGFFSLSHLLLEWSPYPAKAGGSLADICSTSSTAILSLVQLVRNLFPLHRQSRDLSLVSTTACRIWHSHHCHFFPPCVHSQFWLEFPMTDFRPTKTTLLWSPLLPQRDLYSLSIVYASQCFYQTNTWSGRALGIAATPTYWAGMLKNAAAARLWQLPRVKVSHRRMKMQVFRIDYAACSSFTSFSSY